MTGTIRNVITGCEADAVAVASACSTSVVKTILQARIGFCCNFCSIMASLLSETLFSVKDIQINVYDMSSLMFTSVHCKTSVLFLLSVIIFK